MVNYDVIINTCSTNMMTEPTSSDSGVLWYKGHAQQLVDKLVQLNWPAEDNEQIILSTVTYAGTTDRAVCSVITGGGLDIII